MQTGKKNTVTDKRSSAAAETRQKVIRRAGSQPSLQMRTPVLLTDEDPVLHTDEDPQTSLWMRTPVVITDEDHILLMDEVPRPPYG